ncbi:decaprenyl-phosphate phosphoribosyltransferase [Candidatus Woesearchaeota archaeon]|nr:decaprenyl-phosphate phosphoribosyltransferase [Candidatus Woesearchaeota archaeon]
MALKHFLKLARPWQWYKNLVVFLPLIFALRLFNIQALFKVFQAFIVFCLASSGNYFINDVLDAPKDRLNPEKKHRPIASGLVKPWQGLIAGLILYFLAILIAFKTGSSLAILVIVFIILTFLYSWFFKKELFADITLIGINFVIRAVAGALAISVEISPWLIVSVFFLAVFLAVSKRYSEALILKEQAAKHRMVLKHYTPELASNLLNISTSVLLVSYAFYSFQSWHKGLIYTLPIAFYALMRYNFLIRSDGKIARHPELFFKDLRLLISFALFAIIVFVVLYWSSITIYLQTIV